MTAKNFKGIWDQKRDVLLANPDKCAVTVKADSHLVDGFMSRVKARDFDIKRQSAELRFDYEPSANLQFIVSGGLNRADYIELTGLGAGQGKDWASNYAQARLIYGNLFAQVFRNWSDAGDTFLLGSGTPIVDRSSINVFQIQHGASGRWPDASITQWLNDQAVTGVATCGCSP